MGTDDDPEAYLNTSKRVTTAPGWPAAQWPAILTPCLTRLAQEAIDTLTATQMAWDTILGH